MEKEWEISTLDELEKVAGEILSAVKSHKFALYGDLGAGKTAFVKKCGHLTGIRDEISSPTFALVNEYTINDKVKFYHLDVYRLKDPYELYDIGFEEFMDSEDYVFIEWAEKVEQLIPSSFCKIEITLLPGGKRKILLIEDFF